MKTSRVEMNWSENVQFAASGVEHPQTIDHLQELVAAAPTVKALGTRHSFNRIADTTGLLVSTAALDLDVHVNTTTMTARVPGGWSYAEVAAALERAGVALRNMGSLPHISLAGGTATGTHGSGDTNQILAAEVCAIEYVAADGSLVQVDSSTPEFGAVAVGLGAIGVITTMTFDVVPTYLVRQDLYKAAPWSAVLTHLDEIMASAYSVNLHADFSSADTRSIWQKSIVSPDDGPVSPRRWGAERLDQAELEPGRITPLLPAGPWCDRLPHFVPEGTPSAGGDELQTEYFVDRSDAVAAIEALRSMGDRIDPHLHGTEIRTVAADDLWLSPTVGRECLAIGFTWKKHPKEVLALLPEIESALRAFTPTPHWGKLFAFDRDELLERFDRLDEFLAVVDTLDPDGKFANDFLRNLRASG